MDVTWLLVSMDTYEFIYIHRNAVTPKVATTTEKDSPPPLPSAHVPMPDLTSQPLDPDEPTYCLCQQVSFGEMIGCDNDDVSV